MSDSPTLPQPPSGRPFQGPPIQRLRIEGTRIQITGSSGSGKSTLAAQLGTLLDLPVVEIDALNWEPGWHDLSKRAPAELERRLRAATDSDHWIVAGSYSRFTQTIVWPRVETVVWLDLPLAQLILRVVRRTWRRWWTRELLWGTNYDSFWKLLRIWSPDQSLLACLIANHRDRRQRMLQRTADARWSRIHFVRLRSSTEVQSLLDQLQTDPRRSARAPSSAQPG